MAQVIFSDEGEIFMFMIQRNYQTKIGETTDFQN
jgi:hypothetical protein